MASNVLKNMLRRQNMSLKDLSDKTGISIHTLYSLTSGRSTPRQKTVQKLAEAFNCSPETFVFPNLGQVANEFGPDSLETMVQLYKDGLEAVESAATTQHKYLDEKTKSALAKEAVKMAVERAKKNNTHPQMDEHFIEFLIAMH